MPRKVRQLRADLRRAGFEWRPGKGSHGVWAHPRYPQIVVSLSGNDGDDAQPYQEREVRDALRLFEEAAGGRMTEQQDPIRYSMIIEWEPIGEVYVVTVPELPGCKTHGRTYEEAVRQGQDAIESWIDAVRAWGREIPPPRFYDLGDWQEDEAAEPALAAAERT